MVLLAVVLLATTGCFKKVTTDTTLRIKVNVQEVSAGELAPAEGCYGYIYYTEKENWTVASYEDAAAKTITNIETGEKLSEPNVESEPYEHEGSTNNYISMFQSGAPALVVVVYPETKMYAYMYRKAEAQNLTYTYLAITFRPWNSGIYYEGSKEGYRWTIVAPSTEDGGDEGSENTNE